MQSKYTFFAIAFVGVLVLSGCTAQSDIMGQDKSPEPVKGDASEEQGSVKDKNNQVRQYLTGNISEYAPQMPVLGGAWRVTNIQFIEDKDRALVSYEDGHIAGQTLVDFRIESNNTVHISSAIRVYSDVEEYINVNIGKRFAIALESNPSTGFDWIIETVEDNPDKIVQYVGSEYISNMTKQDIEREIVGVGGIEYIIYEAENLGMDEVKLMYMQPRENAQSAEIKIFNVTVGHENAVETYK